MSDWPIVPGGATRDTRMLTYLTLIDQGFSTTAKEFGLAYCAWRGYTSNDTRMVTCLTFIDQGFSTTAKEFGLAGRTGARL